MFSQQVTDGLHKNFSPYMKVQFLLQNHPKFASVLKDSEKSGAKKKGCRTNAVSKSGKTLITESSQKQPSAALASSQHPMGRDSAKKIKVTEFVVDKVAQGIFKAIAPNTPQPVNNLAMKILEGGISKANDTM